MKKSILAVFIILFSLPVWAEGQVLSLEEAVKRGVAQSLSLQKSAMDIELKKNAAENTWALFFTGLSVDGSLGMTDGFFDSAEPQLSWSLGLNFSLAVSGSIQAQIKNLRLVYSGALLDFEEARRQLELKISKTFFTLRAEEDNLKILEEALSLAQTQRNNNETSFRSGYLSEVNLLRSRLEVENKALALAKAKTLHQANVDAFLVLLGMELDTEEVTLSGEMEIAEARPDAEALIRDYLEARPDIQSQRRKIESLENQEKLTRNSLQIPSLRLSGGWGGGYSTQRDLYDSFSLSLALSVPLDAFIPGTDDSRTILSAKNALAQARLDLLEMERTAKAQIRSLSAQIRDSWASVQTARLSVQIAERTYQLSAEGYRRGSVEYLELETLRQSLRESRQQLLSEETNYRGLILDLAAALNIDWQELLVKE
jgi:outer membrane protein TolC